MSDPVTNIEIEDVLSSIRRLVSEGDKLRPGASMSHESATRSNEAPAAETLAERASLPPRFVLTPSLRVDEAPLVLEGSEAATDDSAPNEDDQAPAAESLIAESFVAATSSPDTCMADDATAHFATAPEAIAPDDVEQDVAAEDSIAEVEDTTSPGRSRLEATIAELEAAIIGGTDDWEPDGSEETPVVDWSNERAEGLFTSARTLPTEAASDAVVLTPSSAKRDDVSKDAPTSRFSLQPEASAEPEQEVIAPELSREEADDDLADDLLRSEDGSYDPDLDKDLAAYLERDQILDEETLRNLVIEIVRQELQGTLGERITRNVRKLVRREIYRVLASQDFD